ncbi:hypothetical protein ACVIGA_000004 [Bradyrhizobium sp. USDA 3240]
MAQEPKISHSGFRMIRRRTRPRSDMPKGAKLGLADVLELFKLMR